VKDRKDWYHAGSRYIPVFAIFRLENCPAASLVLFDHIRADVELGASVFWVRPSMLLGEPLEQFLAHWERKRDGRRRGIVEIRP
jgi:hypothetical protein